MHKILRKEVLAPNIKLMEVEAPLIAKKRKAGQFLILRIDEKGERIPLTIADSNPEKGTVTIIFQEVGKTTYQLGLLNEGDYIADIVGPLGHPTEIEGYKKVVCVGGGVGTAVVYPIAVALHKQGTHVISIVGARSKELIILEEEIKNISNELIITTDDGSYGKKGFVTDALKEILERDKDIDLVIAIGPAIMMKFVSLLTKDYGIKTLVSLNSIMVDGTGMCGACRITVGGETKFVCVDGPEFDGHLVDFDQLLDRQKIYIEEEKCALAEFLKEHPELQQGGK